MTKPSLDIEGVLDGLGIVVVSKRRKRDKTHELWASCPNPEHDDRHPSWSINDVSLKHACMSCGYAGAIHDLFILRGQPVPEDLGQRIDKASAITAALRTVTRDVLPEFEAYDIHEWDIRNRYGDVPEVLLYKKCLTRVAADTYDVRWDKRERCWVLPIKGPKGDLWGYQFRQKGVRPDTKPEGIAKSETLFGLSVMRKYPNILVVESPLDAVRCFSIGIPAVATLGMFVSEVQAKLLARNFTRVVIGLDNDDAGHRGAAALGRMLDYRNTYHIPLSYHGLGDAKDPGEVEDDDALLAAWKQALRIFQW